MNTSVDNSTASTDVIGIDKSPVSADATQFDAAWKATLDAFGDDFEPAASSVAGPSALGNAVAQQAAQLSDSHAPITMEALQKMSAVEVIETLSSQKIAQDSAAAMMNINMQLMKTARQSVDAVMNSK